MDDYFYEVEKSIEEGLLLSIPDITIRFFEDPEESCIEKIEHAQGYPIPRRKDYIYLPSRPEACYRVRNVNIIYNKEDIMIEVFVDWVDESSLKM